MTSDGDALFRAICEEPWEDTPRLVYADWLQENGDAGRAEFIRLQVELAKPGANFDAPDLAVRARQLHTESHGRWTRGSPTRPGIRIGRGLCRGFYFEVAFERLQTFTELAHEVFEWTPIESLSIQLKSDESLGDVLSSRYVSRLTKLQLLSYNGDVACKLLANCAKLSHLSELEFPAARATDAGAMLLANSPHLRSLTKVRLGTAPLTASAVSLLAARFAAFAR
jgi:uncharacterized protein (TIGR02996 family)